MADSKAKKPTSKRKAKVSGPESIDITPAPIKLVEKKPKTSKKTTRRPRFSYIYVISALIILFGTTIFWSILSAKIQLGNADQLVYEYLFSSASTLHHATLPAQHSFLIKWPIFYLINLFGVTRTSIILFTVTSVLITVGFLVYFIHRIEKRPLVFGTICLALASILLLVPTVPYPGGILPVNMAMIATRNIEYIVYLGSIALLVSSPKLKSYRFWLAAASLGLLIASDKLFLTLSIGAAVLALVYYALIQSWQLVNLSVKWLVNAVIATVGAAILIALIKAVGITGFNNQSGVGPYGIVSSVHKFAEGLFYAVSAIFTNLGANPASSATTLRAIPHELATNLFSVGGFSYVINLILLFTGVYFALRVFLLIKPNKKPKAKPKGVSNSVQLSVLLVWSTIVAVGLYAVSNHDYVVDARYMTIVLFAIFISGATYLRTKQWKPKRVVLTGLVIFASILTGMFYSVHLYNNDKAALQDINNRDSTLAQVLSNHHVTVLVGDYWRVVPTKLVSRSDENIMPMSACTVPLTDLSSHTWQPNLSHQSFAYLLSLDKSLTNYPSCSINQVVSAYGRPNSTTLIAGTPSQPKELLLFYDQGINMHKRKTSAVQETTTILPINISDLTNTSCNTPTIMNIVAHQDDDLLFMNPDTLNSIKAGDCVRTIYITAGNAGAGEYYWLSRQQGSEAAYSYMSGATTVWNQRSVELTNNEYVTVANPKGDTKISLIFMNLPDGNLNGQGFRSSNYESLAKLGAGTINTVNTVDGQSEYTESELVNAITTLLHVYQPTELRTQSTYAGKGSIYHDHSDHNAVGALVAVAYKQYLAQQFAGISSIPIKYYLGYTVRQFPQNVSGDDLQQKEATFLVYAEHDNNVCHTMQVCLDTPTYDGYLTRQYQYDY